MSTVKPASRSILVAVVALLTSLAPFTPAAAAVPDISSPVHALTTTSCVTFVETPLIGAPRDLAYGPLGRIWVAEQSAPVSFVQGIDPTGATAPLTWPLPEPDFALGSGVVPIGIGADGGVWLVGWGPDYDRLGRIEPSTGAYTFFDLPAGSGPTRVVNGPDGNLWITAQHSDAILKVTLSGSVATSVASFALPSGSAPTGITVGPDGNLWFAEAGTGKIGRMTTAGALITEYSVGSDPRFLASDASSVWFTRGADSVGRVVVAGGTVQQVATPTPLSAPTGVAVDATGAVWFSEPAVGKVGRIDTAAFPAPSSINETVLPMSIMNAGTMAGLADGTIWVAEGGPFLMHFKPKADGTVLPLPPTVQFVIGGPSGIGPGGETVYATTTPFTINTGGSGECADSITYTASPAGGPLGTPVTVTGTTTTFSLPANGTWLITFFSTGAGGSSPASSVTIIVNDDAFNDLTPPTVTVPANITTPATSPFGAIVTFTVTATDNVDPSPSITCTVPSGATFPPGVTPVSCTAKDVAKNTSLAKTFTVTVIVPPPTLDVPASVTVAATGLATDVPIPATASSIVDGIALNITCSGPGVSPTSGITPTTLHILAPAGSRTLVCTVTDNWTNSVSKNVAIIVTTPPPTISVPETTITAPATSPSGANVTFSASGSSLGYGPLAATCDHPSGSLFAIGPTLVKCTTTDPEGRSASGQFTVMITAPAITLSLPAPISVSTFRSDGAPVAYTVTASSAVYPAAQLTLTCAPSSGATFPIGTTTVKCSVSDPVGNVTKGSFNVTVTRSACPDAVVALSATPKSGLTLDGEARISVICGGVVVNATGPEALKLTGKASLSADYVRVVGGVKASKGTTITPAPSTGVPPTANPYGYLGQPDMAGLPTLPAAKIKGAATLTPGIYVGGISVEDKGDLTLRPGVYVIQGGGFEVEGKGRVSGSGVVLYFRLNTDKKPSCGDIEIGGDARLSLSAPRLGTHAGVLFHVDPSCSSKVKIDGNGTLTSLLGALYAPTSAVDISGKGTARVALQIVADTIKVSGGGTIVLDLR